MLETINYTGNDPVNKWAQLFLAVATIKFNFSFIKKSLEFREVLFGLDIDYKQPYRLNIDQSRKRSHTN